jgi:uncharacterized protein YxjI
MSFNRFRVIQKAFSLGKKYEIIDAYDQVAYYAKRKLLSFSQHTKLYDSFDELVYEIRKKPLSFKSEYFIFENGDKRHRVFKKIVEIHPELFCESLTDSEAFYAQGNLLGYEFSFHTEGKEIARVSKKMLSLDDIYAVEVEESFNERLVLAVVLIIDLMSKKDK